MIRSTSNTSSSEILPVSEPEFEAALMFPSQLMLIRHTKSAFQYFRTLYCLVQHQKWKTFEKSQFSQWFDKSEFKWRKNTQNQKSKCLSTKKMANTVTFNTAMNTVDTKVSTMKWNACLWMFSLFATGMSHSDLIPWNSATALFVFIRINTPWKSGAKPTQLQPNCVWWC